MADVIRMPSIWDYLGQGMQTGVKSFQDIRKEEEAKKMAALGIDTQLFNQGSMDAADYNQRYESLFKRSPNVKASKEERARGVLATDLNPATGKPWTYAERYNAGLPSASAEVKDKSEGVVAQQTIDMAGIRNDYLSGKPITGRAAAALGLPDDETITAGRLAMQDKTLSSIGPKYTDTILAPVMSANGGRIPTQGWKGLADQAYASYEKDRKAQGLPANPQAQAYFTTQLLDRLTKQRELDISQQNANTAGTMRQLSHEDKLFTQLGTVVATRENIIANLVKANPAIATMSAIAARNPANPKNKDENIIAYRKAISDRQQAQNAQAQISTNSPELRQLLSVDPNAEAAPQQQTQTTDFVNQAIGRIKSGVSKVAELKDLLDANQITIEQYNAVLEGLRPATTARTR